MSGKLLGSKVDWKIEVEPGKWLDLVFDRKSDFIIIPWQDAFALTDLMLQIVEDVGNEFPKYPDRSLVNREQSQILLNWDKDVVVLMVEWTDRVRFTTLEAFYLTAQAIRKLAQDSQLANEKGIRFEYNSAGMIRKLHNLKMDYIQKVR